MLRKVLVMTKTQYKVFLNSEEWQQIRRQCLQRSKQGNSNILIGKCEMCGYVAWKPQSLQCHHKTYNMPNKSLRQALLDVDNIEVLCVNCHKLRHKRE